MTHLPAITKWPAATRERVAAAILDAALPTCTYRFEMRDGAWTVSAPEPPPEQWVYPPNDVLLDFLAERVALAFPLLRMIYRTDDGPTTLVESASVESRLLTSAEAALKLRCSIKTLFGHVASGALRYVDVGHGRKRPRRMFTDADLDAFIANQTRKDAPCPSTKTETAARRISTTTSKCEVIGFTARRNARLAAKPKR